MLVSVALVSECAKTDWNPTRTAPAQSSFQSDSQVPSDRLYALYVDEAGKYDSALSERLKTGSDSLLIFVCCFQHELWHAADRSRRLVFSQQQ